MKFPDPAMNTELQLCVSFESSTSSDESDDRDRIVIIAHHADDPTKLSAHYSLDNWCLRAPMAGSYYFAVFIQRNDSILEPPAPPPVILIRTVSTGKHSFLDHNEIVVETFQT